jgi:hypothetical protein
MRKTHFVFFVPFALLSSQCGIHAYAQGAASYTSSPATADHSGALALEPLICIDAQSGVAIRLGGSCTLVGAYRGRHGRGSTPGGMGSLGDVDECALPTADGSIPIRVTTSTFERNLDAVDLTVGGRTEDGRYVTYRFTGVVGDNAEGDTCDALFRSSPRSRLPPDVAPDDERAAR